MSINTTKNPHVNQIGELHLSGNVIPNIWWQRLRLESGAVDFTAVIILAEIVYWYKPTIVRDEYSGAIIEVKQKFRADKLQRSYQSFADQFGLSKKQVREAMQRLVDRELISTEFRIVAANNTVLNNVLFIDVIPQKIKNLSSLDSPIPLEGTPHVTCEFTPCYPTGKEGLSPQVGTYTDNNTNITTNITTNNTAAPLEEIQPDKIDLLNNQPLQDSTQTIDNPTLSNGFKEKKEKSFAKKEKAAATTPTPEELAQQALLWAFIQADPYWRSNASCKTPSGAFKHAVNTRQRERGLWAQFCEYQQNQSAAKAKVPRHAPLSQTMSTPEMPSIFDDDFSSI